MFRKTMSVFMAGCGIASAAGQSYLLTEITPIAGASQSHAVDINDKNQVCGWDFTTWYDYRAFYWENGVTSIISGGLGYGQAFGINQQSEVTGSMMDIFVYDIDTGAIYFVTRPGNWAYGYAINKKGNIAGSYYTDWTTQVLKPFFYQNGVMKLLPSLGGSKVGVANDVNQSDHVTGWTKAVDQQFHMFVYDGEMRDCGFPPGADGSGGYEITDADLIAGYYTIAGKKQAALHDYVSGEWTTIGLLPGGGNSSEALGLNDLGQVVGTAKDALGVDHAFIWDATNGLRDLNDLIPPDAGWELNYAEAINNLGVIVGTGTLGGNLMPYLLTPQSILCSGDANGDSTVDPLDSGFVQARFGCLVGTGDPECDAADQNLDGLVDPLDVGFVMARFGACP